MTWCRCRFFSDKHANHSIKILDEKNVNQLLWLLRLLLASVSACVFSPCSCPCSCCKSSLLEPHSHLLRILLQERHCALLRGDSALEVDCRITPAHGYHCNKHQRQATKNHAGNDATQIVVIVDGMPMATTSTQHFSNTAVVLCGSPKASLDTSSEHDGFEDCEVGIPKAVDDLRVKNNIEARRCQ